MNLQSLSLLVLSINLFVAEGKKKKSKRLQEQSSINELMEYAFLGLGVIALIGVLVYLLKKRQQLMRAQKLRSIKKALEVKELVRKDRPCTMTQMQKDEAIAWFSKQNWILQQSQGKDKPITTKLQLVSVKRKSQSIDGTKLLKDYYDAFYVEMKSGSYYFFGVIMFEKYYMTLIFQKSASNSKNQDGTYNYKLFEGTHKKGNFEGKWYLSNDTKIAAQREALKERQKNSEQVSERSFSKGDSDDFSPTRISKQPRGTFKLYHT